MQSLRDKLIQAGLVKPEAAREVRREATPGEGPTARAAEPAKLPPVLPGSKAHQRLQALQQAELDKKLRELVRRFEVSIEPGEHAFYFATRKGKLRRLELSPEQAKRLEEGSLAIVERPEPAQLEHSLVPASAADQVLSLSQRAVRFYNRPGSPIGLLAEDLDAAARSSQAAEPVRSPASSPAQEDGSG
ncbi:MAG TPA: DUF2058 family protein [Myxococcaceae bacterium]|nr:DUF2058 family protein [Myxococcaceae bacterium]